MEVANQLSGFDLMGSYPVNDASFWHHFSHWNGAWCKHPLSADSIRRLLIVRVTDREKSMACTDTSPRDNDRSCGILSWPYAWRASF